MCEDIFMPHVRNLCVYIYITRFIQFLLFKIHLLKEIKQENTIHNTIFIISILKAGKIDNVLFRLQYFKKLHYVTLYWDKLN